MKALQDRKLVLLCVEPSSPKIKQVSLQKGVQDFTADEEYTKNSKVVAVNAGDSVEATFLKDLRVDPNTADRVTVLMAPPAAVVGTFVGDVTKDQLTAKLKSAQSWLEAVALVEAAAPRSEGTLQGYWPSSCLLRGSRYLTAPSW